MENKYEYQNKLEWCPEIPGFVTYVLMLSNGDLYKGYTGNFKQRMLNHFNGKGCSTTIKYSPVYIYHYESFRTKEEAIDREIFLKKHGYTWLRELSNIKSIKP